MIFAYESFAGTTESNQMGIPQDTKTIAVQITDTASGTTVSLKLQGSITLDGTMVDLIPEGAKDAEMKAEGIYRFDGRGLSVVQIYGNTANLKVEAVAAG